MSSKTLQTRAIRSGPTATVESARVRIAQSLVGATPDELAALVGLSSDTLKNCWASHPTESLSELSTAIRFVMSCHQNSGAAEPQPVKASERDMSGIETVVQDFIGLRSAWGSRNARSLAAWMTELDPARAGGIAATAASAQLEQAPVARAMRQTALVVDDSPDIVIIASAFLNDLGFYVIHANTAHAALAILADEAPVDLLVTDYAMPGMNGHDLVVQAREQNPKQRALMITGYVDSSRLMDIPEGVAVLAKPFRRADLYKCILSIIGPVVHPEDLATATHESVPAP